MTLKSLVTYRPVLQAIERYLEERKVDLTTAHMNSVAEIKRRLQALESLVPSLEAINAEISAADLGSIKFDPSTDTLTFAARGMTASIRLRRQDPNVDPQIRQAVAIGAYRAGDKAPPQVGGTEEARRSMEDLLVTYYTHAHRVLKLVKTLPRLKRFKCMSITGVRNSLLEHPTDGAPYTFGYGTGGPFVRPLKSVKDDWRDEGLIANSAAFATALQTAFEKASAPNNEPAAAPNSP